MAIAARAYELGYRVEHPLPIVFLFKPPDSSSFEKVVSFCRPVKVISPGENEEAAKKAGLDIARKVLSL